MQIMYCHHHVGQLSSTCLRYYSKWPRWAIPKNMKVHQNQPSHENSTAHTTIRVVRWVMKYKKYKSTFQSYVLPQIILISHTSFGIFFHGLTTLVGIGLLILQGFVIMLRCGLLRHGLHRATLNASRQFTLLKLLVTKSQSQGAKLKSVQLYWILAG
jgi:hypothetical protein